MKQRLTTKELADRWGIHPGTLRTWRSEGTGPVYIKLGEGQTSRVFYCLEDIKEFEERWTRKAKAPQKKRRIKA